MSAAGPSLCPVTGFSSPTRFLSGGPSAGQVVPRPETRESLGAQGPLAGRGVWRRCRGDSMERICFLRPTRATHPLYVSETKDFPCSGPTYFFLFLSVALNLSWSLLVRDAAGGEVTQTPGSRPRPLPQGILPAFGAGFLWKALPSVPPLPRSAARHSRCQAFARPPGCYGLLLSHPRTLAVSWGLFMGFQASWAGVSVARCVQPASADLRLGSRNPLNLTRGSSFLSEENKVLTAKIL